MNKVQTKSSIGKIIINDFSKRASVKHHTSKDVVCTQVYNFNITNGVIKSAMGVKALKVHALNTKDSDQYQLGYRDLGIYQFNKVMYFKQYFQPLNQTSHRLLIHGGDNKLYLYDLFSGTNSINWVYDLQFDNIPAVLEYKKDGVDSILISSTDKLVVWTTGKTPYEITNVPTITSMCIYNDELYCTIAGDTEKLWYTKNLDPESIGIESESTKYIILDGKAGGGKKIIVLKENMYVFCDYGIYRLNTYAKAEPTLHLVYLFNSQLSSNTVVVCGDEVMFATRQGLYKFNGTSVEVVDTLKRQLQGCNNDNATATYLQGNYYFATWIDFNDNQLIGAEYYGAGAIKNNAIIKLNVYDNTYEVLRGVDVKDMLALKAGVEEKVVLTFNTYHQGEIAEISDDAMIFSSTYKGEYRTNYIMPEDMDRVVITDIKIDGCKGTSISIKSEKDTKSFHAYDDGITHFKTSIEGCKFMITISTQNENRGVELVELDYIKSK